jgi:hypothetical protein
MNESFSFDPTSQELYLEYKHAYSAVSEARHILPPPDIDMSLMIDEADTVISTVDVDIDTRQDLLIKLAEMKTTSMTTRLRIQQMSIIVAEHALKCEINLTRDVYNRKKDDWHEEALIEDSLRDN